MSTRMDLDLLGVVFTDYHLVDVGAAAFQLAHDWFIKQDLVIRDAPAGGGNLLVEGVDYTLATESLDETGAGFSIPRLSTRVTAAVGAGRNVYCQIAVINAAYQAGDLYFSGKYVGDSVEQIDHEARLVVAITGADHTVLDDDDMGVLEVDPDGADRTVTLPTVADNLHRELTIVNSAAVNTTFKVIVEGEGAELINDVTTWWVFPGQSITLKSNGTIWRKIAGHEPVIIVEDQKAANTGGGTFTNGAWRLRTLNTEVVNEIAGASLAANQLTLPPGLYEIEFWAPAQAVGRHKAKLIISGGANLIVGSSMNAYNNFSHGLDLIALAAATVTELWHRCETTVATTGMGQESNFAETEVYSRVKARKVA